MSTNDHENGSDILPILRAGHPVLRHPATHVPDETRVHEKFALLVDRMRATMYDAPGVGLAGPQINAALRVAVVEDRAEYVSDSPSDIVALLERTPVPFTVLVNPTYERASDETVTAGEGCLSVPGYRALVTRYRSVRVQWTDMQGNARNEVWTGWPARIAQHEIDHLNGILYVDRMHTRAFMNEDVWAIIWRDRSPAEVCAEFGVEQPAKVTHVPSESSDSTHR